MPSKDKKSSNKAIVRLSKAEKAAVKAMKKGLEDAAAFAKAATHDEVRAGVLSLDQLKANLTADDTDNEKREMIVYLARLIAGLELGDVQGIAMVVQDSVSLSCVHHGIANHHMVGSMEVLKAHIIKALPPLGPGMPTV